MNGTVKMPKSFEELALHASLYAAPTGYAISLFLQTRKYPATAYQYRVIDLQSSDEFYPNDMTKAVFEGWWRNYNDDAMRRLGVCPIDTLYANTLQYKQDIRRQFSKAKQQGYQGQPKPLPGEWRYYQVRKWREVDRLAGDTLHGALRNLSAAINNQQLLIEPDMAQKLRDEMAGEYDWDVGVKAMPATLAVFVQAFSQMPLKVKRTAAQAYLRKGFV